MNQLNQVIIEGNVVKEPEKKILKNGSAFCSIPIAVNRTYKTKEGKFEKEVSFFDIDTFGKFAELCSTLCPKGRGIRVVGRLRQNRWADEDGKNHSKINVMAEHIEFMPVFHKNSEGQNVKESEKSQSADAGSSSPSKKQKLAMLAEAAAAAQIEQEKGEEVVF